MRFSFFAFSVVALVGCSSSNDTVAPPIDDATNDTMTTDTAAGDAITNDAGGDDTSTAIDSGAFGDAPAEAAVEGGTDAGPKPTIAILHPGDKACYVDPAGTQLVRVGVTDFTLADPGTCAGTPRCGHVYVTIDGSNCNAPGKPYNTVIGASAQSDLQLGFCKTKGGIKIITVQLRNDDGSAFVPNVTANKAVSFTGPC